METIKKNATALSMQSRKPTEMTNVRVEIVEILKKKTNLVNELIKLT